MVIKITSTSTSPVSTPLGNLTAGQVVTATVPPEQAQLMGYELTSLSNAGLIKVVALDDPNLLPIFDTAGGGATATETAFVATGASGTNVYSMQPGARVNFDAADASSYLERNAANQLHTPAALVVDGGVQTNTINASSVSSVSVFGAPTSTGTAIGTLVGSSTVLSTSGDKLLSIKNSGTEKAFVDYNGAGSFVGGLTISGANKVLTIGSETFTESAGAGGTLTLVTGGGGLALSSAPFTMSNGQSI